MPPTPLEQRYIALEAFLQTHAGLWQPAPFHTPVPSWAASHSALYDGLLALPTDALHVLEHDTPALLAWLAARVPALGVLPELIALPAWQGQLEKPWPTGFAWEIPGRKWAQIEAFAAMLHPQARLLMPGQETQPASAAARSPVSRLVDWCAGKGHLSRSLAYQLAIDVNALEWDPALNAAARQRHQKHGARVSCFLQDVLADSAGHHLDGDCHGVALHACGKLHLRLMTIAIQQRAAALSLSPCCYHLLDEAHYVPLAAVPASALPTRLILARDLLRLAMQETVTANGHARRLQARKSAWKLGLKQVLASTTGRAETTALSLADRCFHGSFEDFCQAAAQRLGVSLPDGVAWEQAENAGWQAQARLQRLELLRHGFRRALEVWLCLDRACWLEQQGYEVSLGTFCEPKVTPRNVLIQAFKRPDFLNGHH